MEKKFKYLDIGRRIQFLMDEQSLSQSKLADIVSIDQSSVSKWIKGKTKPNAQSIEILCLRFGYRPEWILDGEEPMLTPNVFRDIKDLDATITLELLKNPELKNLVARISKLEKAKLMQFVSFLDYLEKAPEGQADTLTQDLLRFLISR
jgi:transcriptional regulator with XRE-family HTH domain